MLYTGRYTSKFAPIVLVFSLLASTAFTSPTVTYAEEESTMVFGSDFEDATLQGWKPRIGGELLTVSNQTANDSTYSMLVEQRERSYYGPMLELVNVLERNEEYEFKAYVRLKEEPTENKTLQMTAYKNAGAESWNALDSVVIEKANWQQWHELKGQFQYSDNPAELNLFIETPYISEDTVDTLSFYVDNFTIKGAAPLVIEEQIPELKEHFEDDFPIGAAVYTWQMEGAYGELLKKHFNSLTATYEMKPKFISPAEGQYVFQAADRYVQFAEDNHMQIRGHALLWHIDAAEWMLKDSAGQPASRELLLDRIQSYIETVMTRYKGKVDAWDVVNEAIADNGGDENGMRISPFYTQIGPDYVEKAFEFARAADPDAKLYYNEYFTEVPEKRAYMYELVKGLKEKGLIDGVGLQSHYGLDSPPIEEIEKTLNMFIDLGLDIQITELDVDSGIPFGQTMPNDIAVKQAHRYKELFELYKEYKAHISSVTLWGLQDEKSYNNQAMLFDGKLQAKQAYWGLIDPSLLPVQTNRVASLAGTPTAGTVLAKEWSHAVLSKLKGSHSLSGTFRTLWDEDYLHVLVNVKDVTYHANDRIELFMDENNAKSSVYEQDDRHITLKRFGPAPNGIISKTREIPEGYSIEASIPWEIVQAALNADVGFDIRITDEASANGEQTIYWNDSTLSQQDDPSKFGIIQLDSMPKTAESVKGEAQIDGIMEAAWDQAAPFQLDVLNQPGGATAVARSMWSNDSLYLFIEVEDPIILTNGLNPWDQDSVEIFIDENHQRTAFYQYDDVQFRVNADNAATFGGGAAPSRLESAVTRTDIGYNVEVKIKFNSLQPIPGSAIGLDLQVNDDKGTGQNSNAKWNDPTNETWRNTSKFGILTFVWPE